MGKGNGTAAGGAIDADTLRELHRLARSVPTSGRAAMAKASAIRTIERLQRERKRQPVPPMPDGWYPHRPDDPYYALDWEFLHRHRRIREAWWQAAWREGRAGADAR